MTPPVVVSDPTSMLAGLSPVLHPGRFVFVSLPPARVAAFLDDAVAMLREAEGVSLILPEARAAEAGFADAPRMQMLTLNVYSALEGIGLTAGVARALERAGIACNMVAGHHHDHPFVPAGQGERALAVLLALQAAATSG
jgi:hypothetical protein